ncbi:winged helix-turn-helix domain-containing protein [Halobellus rufus]|uniref:winged helix-turn-helix domain-containing protein n=1 Tax=Halobellus rufus TaxID=1448860 RepID=UPI0006796B89|nr:winged helix-turn-helix domain-containing protein [Halobellus rufus]
MPSDEPTDESDASSIDPEDVVEDVEDESEGGPRARLEAEADRAVSEFDEGIVDLLAWLLDTETRARIYVYLRKNPRSTSEEVADGTGLYPSTVREALAELHDEETVTRQKRESAGAGNNPYEYTAIAPSELVRDVASQVQSELNTVFNLDRRLGRSEGDAADDGVGPVSITVDDATDESSASGTGSPDSDAADAPTDDEQSDDGSGDGSESVDIDVDEASPADDDE